VPAVHLAEHVCRFAPAQPVNVRQRRAQKSYVHPAQVRLEVPDLEGDLRAGSWYLLRQKVRESGRRRREYITTSPSYASRAEIAANMPWVLPV
jgi:hypothetical protein